MSGATRLSAMTGDEFVRAERGRILATLLDQVEDLADRAVAAMRAEIPAYAAQDAGFRADVRDQVLQHYRAKLAALLEERTVTLDDITFTRRAAMRRARAGLALADYINAFRVGQQVFWEAVVACAGDSLGGHEAALSLATPLMRYCDIASTHAANTYMEFQQYAVAEAARQGRDLVDGLLAGEPPARGPLVTVARRHGLGTDTPMVVVVGVVLGEAPDVDAPYAASAAIAKATSCAARTFAVVRQSEIVAVPVLGPDAAPGPLCDHLVEARERLLDEGIMLALGVSTVIGGVHGIPRAYQEARAVIEYLPEDGGVAALPRLSAFQYLTLRADATARNLVDPRITALLDEDDERGGVITATIRAFAAADLNLRAAAERLQIHHNTAQYRLRRIEERTGRNPRHINDLVDLLVAIALRDALVATDHAEAAKLGGRDR
jgi:PucR C-terminal helix-turn-helix domain/GGDEF-like domain